MQDNKLVIRRLPPSMNEDDFLKQVAPLPNHDYFCFFEAVPGLGPHSYSRAYINFLDPADMAVFRERFDNYVFLDKDGHEYSAVVEQSLWHKCPTNGPFYKGVKQVSLKDELICAQSSLVSETVATNSPPSWIEQDPEFIKFIEKLQAQKKRPQHSPLETLETNLDELTNSEGTTCSGNKDNSKVITPLIGYVNQQRSMKSSKRAK